LFSHPSIFILSGVELSSLIILPASGRQSWLMRRLPVYLSWLTSFILLYWLTIRPTLKNDVLTASFEDRYPESWFDLLWLFDALGRFFYRPLGFFGFTDGIAILVFLLGFIALYRQNKTFLLTLISPFITTLLASYLHKYPFRERLILFLVPFAVIIIAKGISWMIKSRFLQFRGVSILGLSLLAVLLIPRAISASEVFIKPNTVAEIRPILQYIKKQKNPQDMLYIYPSGANQFRYYATKYKFSDKKYMIGHWDIKKTGRKKLDSNDLQGFKSELNQLQGRRVWFVLSDVSDLEEETIFSYLDQISEPINCYRQPGAVTCLYSLPKKFDFHR